MLGEVAGKAREEMEDQVVGQEVVDRNLVSFICFPHIQEEQTEGVGSGKPIQYILLELEPGKELQLGHLESQMVHYILVVEVVEINQQLKVLGLQIQVMEVTVEDGIQVISLAVGLVLP